MNPGLFVYLQRLDGDGLKGGAGVGWIVDFDPRLDVCSLCLDLVFAESTMW